MLFPETTTQLEVMSAHARFKEPSSKLANCAYGSPYMSLHVLLLLKPLDIGRESSLKSWWVVPETAHPSILRHNKSASSESIALWQNLLTWRKSIIMAFKQFWNDDKCSYLIDCDKIMTKWTPSELNNNYKSTLCQCWVRVFNMTAMSSEACLRLSWL